MKSIWEYWFIEEMNGEWRSGHVTDWCNGIVDPGVNFDRGLQIRSWMESFEMKIKEMLKKKKSHLRGDSINEESSGYGSSEGGSATEGGGVRPLGGRGEWAPQHVQAEDDNGLISRWAKLDV